MTTDLAYDERIAAHRASLVSRLAERVDPLDLPRSMTQRDVNSYEMVTMILRQSLRDFDDIVSQWASLPLEAADAAWTDYLHEFRKKLCDELLTIKSPIRDPEVKRRHDALHWSIRFVDQGFRIAPANLPIVDISGQPIGKLMAAAGFATVGDSLRGPQGWQGSIREIEKRTKELDKQRTTLRKMLDRLLVTPEEQAKADDESKAFTATLATMELRNNSTGTGLAAFTKDGDPLPLDAMTSEQRSAFQRFQSAAFPPRESETESVSSEQEMVEP